MRRPGGVAAPTTAQAADGAAIDLVALADEACARFYDRFPAELERSGEVGVEWCRHDNQYLLAWAVQEARDGTVSVAEQALWLARVLGARGFPLPLLVGDLEVAADVARGSPLLGALAAGAGDALARGAEAVAATLAPDGSPAA